MRNLIVFPIAVALSAGVLASCSVGPNYHPPSVPIPTSFKEGVNWKVSDPKDTADRGPWWEIYGDPVLNDLEHKVVLSNQNIKAAEAAYRQSRALVQEARASFLPTITGNAAWTRAQRGTASRPSDVTGQDAPHEPSALTASRAPTCDGKCLDLDEACSRRVHVL